MASGTQSPSPEQFQTLELADIGEEEEEEDWFAAALDAAADTDDKPRVWEGINSSDLPAIHVQAYGTNVFRVNGVEIHSAIVVGPRFVLSWAPTTWDEVTLESLQIVSVLNPKPELIIIGTGSTHEMMPEEWTQHLEAQGVAVQTMCTNFAISTFNVLQEEGRQLVTFLLPMPSPYN